VCRSALGGARRARECGMFRDGKVTIEIACPAPRLLREER
jgi:hypothetical protein